MAAFENISGIMVGHAQNREAGTGVTVVLCPQGAVGGVSVRGGGPGTRETDLLSPGRTVQQIHAVMLCGGSAFGLAAADGAMRWLDEHGYGLEVGPVRVPLVPAAVIFDLGYKRSDIRPDREMGYAACEAAKPGTPPEGSVGAGTGATLGKILGMERAAKGGVGVAALSLPGGGTLAALVVVNAMGHVVDDTGRILAGPKGEDGYADTLELMLGGELGALHYGTNTTIGVLLTDLALTKTQMNRLCDIAQDGFVRAIRPVHTAMDGDTLFGMATGACDVAFDMTLLGAAATEVVAAAIRRAALVAAEEENA